MRRPRLAMNRWVRVAALSGMAMAPAAMWRAHRSAAPLDLALAVSSGRLEVSARQPCARPLRCVANPIGAAVAGAVEGVGAHDASGWLELAAGAPPTLLGEKTLKTIGGRRLGGAWLVDSRLLPEAVDRPTRITSTIVEPEGVVEIGFARSSRVAVIAGAAAAVCGADGGAPPVVAPREEDVALARTIASWRDRIVSAARAAGGDSFARFGASCFVAVGWADDSGNDPIAGHVFGNVMVGPLPPGSGAAGFAVAGGFVLDRLVERGASPLDPVALSFAAAAADLMQQGLGGTPSLLEGAFAEEQQRQRTARVSDPGRYVRREPIDDPSAQIHALQLLAPRVRERLLEELAPGASAVDEQVVARLLRRLAEGVDESALAAWCDPVASRDAAVEAIRAGSIVEPPPARPPAPALVADPLRIELANDHNGYLESCGCKGKQGGGFIDLHQFWAEPGRAPALRLLLGGVLATPESSGYSAEANDLLVGAARDLAVDAWVPNARELVLIASGEIAADAFAGVPLVACNVHARGRAAVTRPFVDVAAPAGPARIIGVYRSTARHATQQMRELIDAAFEVVDPVAPVVEALRSAPAGHALVIAGAVEPLVARRIAAECARPLLFCSSDFLVPRVVDGKVDRVQADGTVDGRPIVFGPAGAYSVKAITWDRGSGAAAIESIALAGREGVAAARDQFRARVQEVLERDSGPVELQFTEPAAGDGNRYVGSEGCASCHRREHADWVGTPHAQAWKTLERVQRQRVRNCVACHVVGWGQQTGYDFKRPDVALRGVGCEVCHGPGGGHVDSGGSKETIRRSPSRDLCASCHTIDHSEMLLLGHEHFRSRVDHRSAPREK